MNKVVVSISVRVEQTWKRIDSFPFRDQNKGSSEDDSDQDNHVHLVKSEKKYM